MTYEQRVQAFAQQYVDRYGLSRFSENFGVATSTIHGGLKRQGGFARQTHARIARVIKAKVREAHSEGGPLEFDGIPLPVSDELERELYGEPSVPEPARGGGTVQPDNIAGEPEGETEAAAGDDDFESTQDEIPPQEGELAAPEAEHIFVPEGVSVLDPELWTDGPATESARYHDHETTAEDMHQIFAIDPGTIADEDDDPWYGWLGPNPPEGVTLDSPDFRDEITRLTAQWNDGMTALKVVSEIGDKNSERMRPRLLLELYRIELLLVTDCFMTPPSKDIPMDDLERLVEIERLKSEIVTASSQGEGLFRPLKSLMKWALRRND